MTLPRNLAPRAVRDVEDAADWLVDGPCGEPVARRFLAAVAEAAKWVAQHHRRLELLADPYRFRAVRGFPYLLVYNTARAGAPIARVLYMGRDLDPLLADLRDQPGRSEI